MNAQERKYDIILAVSVLHELRLQAILGDVACRYSHSMYSGTVDSRAELNKLYSLQVEVVSERLRKIVRDKLSSLGRDERLSLLDIGCGHSPYLATLLNDKKLADRIHVTCVDNDGNIGDSLHKRFPEGLDFCCKDIVCEVLAEHKVDRCNFLALFFRYLNKRLKPDGLLFVSEFYYPQHLPVSVIREMIRRLRDKTAHGDPNEAFYLPESIDKVAYNEFYDLIDAYDFAPIRRSPIELKEMDSLLCRRRYRIGVYGHRQIDEADTQCIEGASQSVISFDKFARDISDDVASISQTEDIISSTLFGDEDADVLHALNKAFSPDKKGISRAWNLGLSAERIAKDWLAHDENCRNAVCKYTYLTLWISINSQLWDEFSSEAGAVSKTRFDPLSGGLPAGYCMETKKVEGREDVHAVLAQDLSSIAYNHLLSPSVKIGSDTVSGVSMYKLFSSRNTETTGYDDRIKSFSYVCRCAMPELVSEDRELVKAYGELLDTYTGIQNLCRSRGRGHYTVDIDFGSISSSVLTIEEPLNKCPPKSDLKVVDRAVGEGDNSRGLFHFVFGYSWNDSSRTSVGNLFSYCMLLTFLDFLFLGYRIKIKEIVDHTASRGKSERILFLEALSAFKKRTNARLSMFAKDATAEYEQHVEMACEELMRWAFSTIGCDACRLKKFPSVWMTISLDEPKSKISSSSMMLFTDGMVGREFIEDRMMVALRRPLVEYYAAEKRIIEENKDRKLKLSSIKSAIGSIMSRNGSHNIGSHVLAALSHNVGTMPDDRVLYQYIQHRMDYIATVTTDFPMWSQPTMFVGSMIKNFLTQRHLLNHIAGSEGLKAWQYQNQNLGDQSACIRLHVRRIEGGICSEDRKIIVDFFDDAVNAIKLEHDICLAIPGGVVGQHAFFTIIENLIRNAAKHDWSTPPESTKGLKYKRRADAGAVAAKSAKGCADAEVYETEKIDGRDVLKVVGNLDVYIDFEDKPEEGNVEFVVYTNMSDAGVASGTGETSLVQSIQSSLDQPIIDDETGMLRRANWGLAEMKISCGYLQGREISEIGGLAGKNDRARKNDERFGSILTTCAIKINEQDAVSHLGYKFKVPKPRTVVLVTTNGIALETQKKLPKLAEYGVYVKSICHQSGENASSVCKDEIGGEFVLLDSFGKDCYSWKLPFRVIAMKDDKAEPKNLVAKWSCGGNAFSGPLARKTTVDEVIDFVANGDEQHSDIASRAKEVIAHVAACWAHFVCERHRPNVNGEQRVNLVVAPTTKSGTGVQGAGRSLVNPASVASYVFDEGFDAAVSSYEHLYGIDAESTGEKAVCYSVLERLRKLKPRVVAPEYRKSDWGYEEFVQRQIVNWLENLKVDSAECLEVSDYLELKLEEMSHEELKRVKRSLKEVVDRIDAGDRSPDLLATKKSLILKRNELTGQAHETAREAHHYFETFVAYFVEVCRQTKVYLGKYAEDVATVPQSFKKLNNVVGEDRGFENPQYWDAGGLTLYRSEHVESRVEDVTVEYIRHFVENEGVVRESGKEPKFVTDPFSAHPGVKYIESLSGTQSYLSQLQMMRCDDYVMQTKLLENALLRILIIDERVAKFIGDHSDVMLATYSRLNLTVVDDKWMDDALKSGENSCVMGWTPRGLLTLNVSAIKALNEDLLKYKEEDEFKRAFVQGDSAGLDKCYSERFDVAIVHQGIIDKWFPDVAHDANRVTWLYWAMKKLFPYVIITTGRGTPANIPNWARVLPFSTIESTLFRKYPEKLLLVDAIMNILPLSKS